MRHQLPPQIRRLLIGMLLAVVAVLAGCKTADQAASGDTASVQITGHTDAEIQQAATRAFLSNGYLQVNTKTFEKAGTRWDNMAYSGWSASPVWIRVRLHIASPKTGQSVLGCDAFLVVDRNEVTMETENKLSVSHRSECKKILDQARALLESSPSADTL